MGVGPQTYRALPPLFSSDTLVIGAIRISYNDFVHPVVALVGGHRTPRVPAVSDAARGHHARRRWTTGPSSRSTVPSNVRSARSAWIVGCVLAALAGILVAPTLTLSATALTLLIVDAYAASVIGRLRSIPMTFVGALILGLAVSYTVAYLPAEPVRPGVRRRSPRGRALRRRCSCLPQSRLRGHRILRSRELALKPTWRGTGFFAVGVDRGAIMLATVVSQSDLYSLNRVWGLAIIGLSLVPLVGFAGRLSLCQMTFAGIGAVVVGHLGANGNPLALLAAAGLCAVVGVLVALPAFRLSGIYFALSTAAFATAMDAWVFPLPAFNLFGDQFAPFGQGSLTFAPFSVGGHTLSSKEGQFVVGSRDLRLLACARGLGPPVRVRSPPAGPQGQPGRMRNPRDELAAVARSPCSRSPPPSPGSVAGSTDRRSEARRPTSTSSSPGWASSWRWSSSASAPWEPVSVPACSSGGPTLANLFPGLTQLQAVLVGGAGGRNRYQSQRHDPLGPRPLWSSVVRRRALFGAVILAILLLWSLRLSGVIANWPFAWALIAILLLCTIVPYAIDRRRGDAPARSGCQLSSLRVLRSGCRRSRHSS